MTYPPTPDQSGQGGFQYDPYGSQPGSQPQQPGYSPQPQQPGYSQPQQPGYGAAPQLPPAAPGYPPAYGAPGYGPPQPKNGMGTTSLVLGIIGLVTAWIPGVACFGWIMCILAVIFGGIGISNANKGLATNKNVAVTGLVLGIAAFALGIIITLAVWGSIFSMGTASTF
ncbi:hypothetical protein GCM10009853_069200 [Glycomyces scopariae]|uniref:DUF4190 domain-containing protein n=1 Tax=Glycomyces sambucus TaxID=380244 RepID=A0A1G9KVT8_9ACTN|nr:DUF4190 domain-containing protein [Glycomyces sambucus]SDL53587.1 hypothetical protein SAMN05216298_4266 [Glycomyces sambucus]